MEPQSNLEKVILFYIKVLHPHVGHHIEITWPGEYEPCYYWTFDCEI